LKILVVGWFSFPEMGATAGDLMVRDLACEWLEESGREYDVAVAPPFEQGVNWNTIDPAGYSDVVFVCGPFGNGWPLTEFLRRFQNSSLVGLNLTVLEPLDDWNPFSLLLERDSDREVRPDLSFAAPRHLVPVVGVALVPDQDLPGARNRAANNVIHQFLAGKEASVVHIDTRLDVPNESGLRTPSEIESLFAAMDVVLTTRLHGTVLALRNGVPVIPVDPIMGGHKLTRQVTRIGWPILFNVGSVTAQGLQEAFDFCRSPAAIEQAHTCASRAAIDALATKEDFLDYFSPDS
jgi:Polysaccharide pyruvyl transferase